MSNWKSGDFDRSKLSTILHPFTPAHATETLQSVNLEHLWLRGKRLLLIDVDNTLVRWHSEDFHDEVLHWVRRAKEIGFEICIISNTKKLDRLARIKDLLGVDTVRGRFKPSRSMYRLALIRYKRKASEAIMIGDQIFTDVLGANRAGIDAIWVRKMEGKEFGPTKISRMMEAILRGSLYEALVVPESAPPLTPEHPTPAENPIIKQLIRFAVVGGTALALDTALKYLFIWHLYIGGQPLGDVFGNYMLKTYPSLFGQYSKPEGPASLFLGNLASFMVMFYSFYLNRIWTFEAQGKDSKSVQVRRFFTVAIIGALINNALLSLFLDHMPHRRLFCIILAAAIAAIWNFGGQRLYAFRARKG